jgi:hypothetical protein
MHVLRVVNHCDQYTTAENGLISLKIKRKSGQSIYQSVLSLEDSVERVYTTAGIISPGSQWINEMVVD